MTAPDVPNDELRLLHGWHASLNDKQQATLSNVLGIQLSTTPSTETCIVDGANRRVAVMLQGDTDGHRIGRLVDADIPWVVEGYASDNDDVWPIAFSLHGAIAKRGADVLQSLDDNVVDDPANASVYEEQRRQVQDVLATLPRMMDCFAWDASADEQVEFSASIDDAEQLFASLAAVPGAFFGISDAEDRIMQFALDGDIVVDFPDAEREGSHQATVTSADVTKLLQEAFRVGVVSVSPEAKFVAW